MRRTALLAALGLGTVAALFVAVLATRAPAVDKQSQSPLLGKPVPEISGRDLNGQPVRLSGLQGRWVLVNFFASWCVPCHQEHPELERFLARHSAAGDATVLGVIVDDTAANARSFFAANGGSWPVVDDPDGQVALDFGVRGPPESFLVAPDGTVMAKFIGPVTAEGLDRLITSARSRA
jgi:cytochrome c biogenesis protein CcmG/thiol:disulfide interchange protein DsbE